GQIDRHGAMCFGKFSNLVVPEMSIATPAVNEDERWFAFALHRVVNGNTIRSRHNRCARRLRKRNHKRQKQNQIQKHFTPQTWMILTAALRGALLGPDAFFNDARMFGRREILIPHTPRWPKS